MGGRTKVPTSSKRDTTEHASRPDGEAAGKLAILASIRQEWRLDQSRGSVGEVPTAEHALEMFPDVWSDVVTAWYCDQLNIRGKEAERESDHNCHGAQNILRAVKSLCFSLNAQMAQLDGLCRELNVTEEDTTGVFVRFYTAARKLDVVARHLAMMRWRVRRILAGLSDPEEFELPARGSNDSI